MNCLHVFETDAVISSSAELEVASTGSELKKAYVST